MTENDIFVRSVWAGLVVSLNIKAWLEIDALFRDDDDDKEEKKEDEKEKEEDDDNEDADEKLHARILCFLKSNEMMITVIT